MKIHAIVLSGGEGRRVGGEDKGMLAWQDATLVESVIGRLHPQVNELCISANRNIPWYESLGHPVYNDTLEGFQGPLAGIATAMEHCSSADIVVTAPCDSPQIPATLVQRLGEPLLNNPEQSLSLVHDGERLQYLFMALRPDCLPSLQIYLQDGGRSVRGWLPQLTYSEVDFSDCPDAFINLNRISDEKKPA